MLTHIPPSGDGLGITVITVEATVLTLALVSIGLRLWARRIKQLSLVFNDYAIIVAWVCSLTASITR